MSRKDYETIATCVRVQTFGTPWQDLDVRTAYAIATAMALEFELSSPRFNRERFMDACGFDPSLA